MYLDFYLEPSLRQSQPLHFIVAAAFGTITTKILVAKDRVRKSCIFYALGVGLLDC